MIARAAKDKTYSDVSLVPHRRVGLVLGCPKRVFGGWSNPYFENRIAAAAELYHHRKIDYLVVSGDNHVQGYDEPTDMKNALVDKGVPFPQSVRALTNVNFHCSPAAATRPDGTHVVEAVTATASFRFGKSMGPWFDRSGARVRCFTP